MPTRAAIYTRISADREGRSLGVARQEADCRERAAQEGATVVEVYSDNDISASTNSRKARPGWDRMLDDAEAGRFDVIIAYSKARLTRRPGEREDLIELHLEHDTRLWLVNSSDPDLATADGRQAFRLLGTMDTAEPERASELIRRKHKELAEAGRYIGPRPFGWDVHGRGAEQRLVINPAEAAVVRECVDRVLVGEGIWRIRNDLNARKITTSTGAPWQTQTLRRMLLRWANAGIRQHQPRRRGKPHGQPVLYPAQWPAIIDRDTHERVLATLTDPGRRSNNRGTAVRYLLTSIARCGICDQYLVGTAAFTYQVKGHKRADGTRSPDRPRHYPHAYKCAHAGCMKVQRNMAAVDQLVEAFTVAYLAREGVRVFGGDQAAAKQARDRIGALEAKLALAADQFADDLITDDQMHRITARLRPQLDAERVRLRQALPEDSLADFTGTTVADAWAGADVEARKRVLRKIIEATGMRIVIDPIGVGNGSTFNPDAVRIEFPQERS